MYNARCTLKWERGGPNKQRERENFKFKFSYPALNINFISSGGLGGGFVGVCVDNHIICKQRQLFLLFHSVCLILPAFL